MIFFFSKSLENTFYLDLWGVVWLVPVDSSFWFFPSVSIFQPNPSTAESSFSKVEILLCAYSLIFPNFYEVILGGNF